MKPSAMIRSIPFQLAAVAVTLAGCQTVPDNFVPLQDARTAYKSAAADPAVTQHAQLELQRAERELRAAEAMQRDTRDAERVEHQAYLALRSAQLAQQTAQLRTAEQQLKQADAERQQLVLASRAREADLERQKAAQQAQQSEAQRAQEAAAAQQQTAELQRRVQQLQSQLDDAKMQQTDRGYVMTFAGDLLFDTGRSELKTGAQRSMQKLAEFLRDNPQRQIAIEGFTDATGGEEMNQALSERRAMAVKRALESMGANPQQIQVAGYGEQYPVASNDTAAGRQLNRRVEIVVGNDGQPARRRQAASN